MSDLATAEEAREALRACEERNTGGWIDCLERTTRLANTVIALSGKTESSGITCLNCHTDAPSGTCPKCCGECRNALISEIGKLRNVLEWYAERKHYVATEVDADSMGMHSRVLADEGERAREALGE